MTEQHHAEDAARHMFYDLERITNAASEAPYQDTTITLLEQWFAVNSLVIAEPCKLNLN